MLCLVQLSKWRECKATDAEKILSQWEKGAKCNFKSTAQVHERCFFFMKWNVICNAEDRFSCVRAFLQSTVLELQCTESLVRASKNTNAVFSATKQWRECKAKDAEKLLSQWEKVAKCNFKSNAQVHERCFFLMKWNVICNAEDRFSCLELFLRAKNTNAVRAKNTNAVFSATKQMKRMQGQGCWKASFSVRERC